MATPLVLPQPDQVRTVAIIGAGTIGASWAAHFLGRGFDVRAWDPAPDGEARARDYVANAWPALERLGLATDADPARLAWFDTPEAAIDGVKFVQESAPEKLDVKRSLYAKFDAALAPDAVMSTSTSGLLMSVLQENREGAERYVLGHPFNPPHLIPVVEVLGGRETDPAVVDWTMEFYNRNGKKAVRLNREVPGHLVNRIQAALWREAAWAVTSGLASVEDVDTAMKYGPGLRWGVMGPHEVFSLAGGPGGMRNFLDHFGPPIESWWADLREVRLDEDARARLIEGCDLALAGRDMTDLAAERDALLLDLLESLNRSRAALAQHKGGDPE